jgi:hypothetical protein
MRVFSLQVTVGVYAMCHELRLILYDRRSFGSSSRPHHESRDRTVVALHRLANVGALVSGEKIALLVFRRIASATWSSVIYFNEY